MPIRLGIVYDGLCATKRQSSFNRGCMAHKAIYSISYLSFFSEVCQPLLQAKTGNVWAAAFKLFV